MAGLRGVGDADAEVVHASGAAQGEFAVGVDVVNRSGSSGELDPQRFDYRRWQVRHKHLMGKSESRQPVVLRGLVPVSVQRRAPICGIS